MPDHDHELDDFRHRVDRIHAATPGSEDAPPDLWNRVRAHIETIEEETSSMSSISMPVDSIPVTNPNAPSGQHRFARYANLAATIALVFALAAGSWFAATRMNQPGSPEPRFAVLPGTPEVADATCDVEPLSLDEAMQILKNPYRVFDSDMDPDGTLEWLQAEDEIKTGNGNVIDLVTDGPRNNLGPQDVDSAIQIGNVYLDCLMHGTKGQVYSLMDPVAVHEELRNQLPLFVTEEEAEELVSAALDQPANDVWMEEDQMQYLVDKDITMNSNPEYQYVDTSLGSIYVAYDALVIAPVVVSNADGEVVIETDFGGFPLVNDGQASRYARNVWVVQSAYDGNWYVLTTRPI